MACSDSNRTTIVGAYRVGILNREEAINELLLIDPNVPVPILEILLTAVERENIIKIKNVEI
jgi:hypothetical protein